MNTMDVRFKIVTDHNSSAFNRSRRIGPIVGKKVIITEEEVSFVRDFGFCNACNRYVVVKAVVLSCLSFSRFVKASNIVCSNS